MRKRRRRALTIAAVAAAIIIAAAAMLWLFRVPILELVPTPPIVVTEKDQGRVISMVRGERLEVRLPSNAYSGSTWRVGMPLPFLPQTGASFTGLARPPKVGDGYQSTTFVATDKGFGPLFLGYLPDSDQNSYTPSRSFTVVVSVK